MVKGCKVPKCKPCFKRDCSKGNGGCHQARSCLKGFGMSFCGNCKKPLVNDGPDGCKKPSKKTTKQPKKTTPKKCPKAKAVKCNCGLTFTMVKGCKVPKCKPCFKRDCSKGNGGCHQSRSCLKGGKVFCGNCKKPL